MAWANLTCGHCGHADDLDAFCSTPIGGPLPKNTYQCPSCCRAFERRSGPDEVMPWGAVIPGPVELVPVVTRL